MFSEQLNVSFASSICWKQIKKSESEKAQQDILVATEHLPKENMVIGNAKLTVNIQIGITFENRHSTFQNALFFPLLKDC